MKKLSNKLIMAALAAAGCLVSCSITSLPGDVRKSIGQTESGIADGNAQAANAKNIKQNNFIQHTNVGYFGNQAITQTDTDFLPPIFSNQIQIDKQFFGVRGIASGITDLTRVPTVLDIANNDVSNEGCNDIRVTQQEGNLIDLLNLIGARCDLGWSYRDGKIVLSDTETKTWIVKGIPGDIQVNNQISNSTGMQSQSGGGGSIGGGSGGGGGGQSQSQGQQSATQSTAFNLQNNLWENLRDALKSILSKNGKLSISPATSSVMVTDKPSALLRVDRYMKNQNDIMKRQVQIDVQVLNVDVDAADNYGINWNLVLKNSNASFSINGQAVTQANSGTGTGTIPSPIFVPTATTQAFTIGATSGNLDGSQLVINALSSVTKTSLVTSTAVTTLSNQPVPVQFVDQQAYLASVQNTISGQSSLSQTTLTPGQLTTGFSLNLLPVVQGDGMVYMQLSINISILKNMAQFSTNGSSLELPNTLQRNLMQKAVVRAGDTFVVTSFDSDSLELTNSGVGGAYNWILGGGVSASKARTRMVILVTPRVVNI
jgi:type IVB pilus formation R64 PilN family outer membrane protein